MRYLLRLTIFGLLFLMLAYPLETSADAPESRFPISQDAMERVTKDAIGFITIVGMDSVLTFYPDYESAADDRNDIPVHIDQIIPFCHYSYQGERLNQGGCYDLPIISMRGQAVEVVYDSENYKTAWMKPSVLPAVENTGELFIFDDLKFTFGRFIHFLPTAGADSIATYDMALEGRAVSGYIHSKYGYWGALIVTRVYRGFAQVARLPHADNFGWHQLSKNRNELIGVFEPLGWVPLRNEAGQLQFWLILIDLC